MTHDRARKKAIRRRMAQTGEKYTAASRALENAQADPETEGAHVEDPARRGQFGRFTEGARQVVAFAREQARTLKHDAVGTEHILLGLLRETDGVAARVLGSLDITFARVQATVVRSAGLRPGLGEGVTAGQLQFTPGAKQALELALREALCLRHNYIGTEHILLGLARENEGTAARILLDFDADADKLRGEVIRNLSGPGGPLLSIGAAAQAREGSNLSERAKDVIDWARRDARALGHDHIGGEHILLGLLREREGLGGHALKALGVTLEQARARVLERVPADTPALTGWRPLTRIFERALHEALARGHNLIGTEHILLALLHETEGNVHAVLLDLDADPQKVRNEILSRLSETA